ncbi:MAG: hypothetical protein AMXMBFR83_03220 [Phycisphaerae bacterium]
MQDGDAALFALGHVDEHDAVAAAGRFGGLVLVRLIERLRRGRGFDARRPRIALIALPVRVALVGSSAVRPAVIARPARVAWLAPAVLLAWGLRGRLRLGGGAVAAGRLVARLSVDALVASAPTAAASATATTTTPALLAFRRTGGGTRAARRAAFRDDGPGLTAGRLTTIRLDRPERGLVIITRRGFDLRR